MLVHKNILLKTNFFIITIRKSVAATENDERVDGEERRGCKGEGWSNGKLITSSIKIAMIHHDVWTGCGSGFIKGRTGYLTG
jgi:hypothetical protein